MRQKPKIILMPAIVLFVALVGCGTELQQKSIDDGPSAESTNSVGQSGPIHSASGWAGTVYMYVDADAPEIVVEATQGAINSWNTAAGVELLSYQGRREPENVGTLFSVLDDETTLIYFDHDWSRHTGKSSGVLGTTVWENDIEDPSRIGRGDIILNAQDYDFVDTIDPDEDYTEAEASKFSFADAETVLVHEMGHLLGLDHVSSTSDGDSVMHAQTAVGLDLANRDISEGDANLIKSIYNPE